MDDLAALRPTIFCSVPRLYNRIYAGILNAVKTSGVLRGRLFNAAYNAKRQALLNGKNLSLMWDRLVFNKLKAKLGGRVHLMVLSASPLSPDIMEFLKIFIDEGDNLGGHVGSPNLACEVKLVDVPEMNYTSDDQPDPRDEAQTREVIDEEGWLHTGDIGTWLPGGHLKQDNGKKNIFKLAQGEYIARENIENIHVKCKFVAQCFVYGREIVIQIRQANMRCPLLLSYFLLSFMMLLSPFVDDSLNSSLVAVVTVDPDVLKAWAALEGITLGDQAQLFSLRIESYETVALIGKKKAAPPPPSKKADAAVTPANDELAKWYEKGRE
ncbi:hypothetical protein HN51_028495 [Arachis hypogaea]